MKPIIGILLGEAAVTIIAGVSCPLTTPAHGTAYDIAGKGIANPNAMEQAIRIAADMAKREVKKTQV